MRDVLADVERWRAQGKRVALATVVEVNGSAPRGVGATLAVSEDGTLSGSVSNGCVEPDVIEHAVRTARTGRPVLLEYGITEAQNLEQIGLSCGGSIRVFVERLDEPLAPTLLASVGAERPVARAVIIGGSSESAATPVGATLLLAEDDTRVGGLGSAKLDEQAIAPLRQALRGGQSAIQPMTEAGQTYEVFVEGLLPAPQLVIIGAGHVGMALARIGQIVGYRIVVADPRAAFARHERFPGVDQLLTEWPDDALHQLAIAPSTAIAVLTHDHKFDVPALAAALSSPAGYVGAIGSRATRDERDQLLREAGVSDEQIGRIHGPIGLDIGAQTPEEIALAIMAEIIATRRLGDD